MNRSNATGRREAAQPKRDRYSAQRSDKPLEVRPPRAPRPPGPGSGWGDGWGDDSWRGRTERTSPSPSTPGGSGLGTGGSAGPLGPRQPPPPPQSPPPAAHHDTRLTAAAARPGACRTQAEEAVEKPKEATKEKPKAAPEQKHKKAGKAGKGHVTGGTGLMDTLTAQREQ